MHHSASWVMEQWLFFLETAHWHVVDNSLEGLLDGAAPEIWRRLQVLALYLLNRPNDGTISRERWQRIHESMRENAHHLARLVEEKHVDELLTMSLHTVICRAFRQEQQQGPSGAWQELYIERIILWMKTRTKYKVLAALLYVLRRCYLPSLVVMELPCEPCCARAWMVTMYL